MASASSLKDVSAPPGRGDVVSGNKDDATTVSSPGGSGEDKKAEDVLASTGEVFSFVRNKKMIANLIIGLFFSAVSGGIMPAMSWIFSSSFTNFAADPGSDEFLADIRTLAFTFMALGAIALVSMTLQATFMEMFAGEMAAVMKEEWFAALMRQDMAYYGTSWLVGAVSFVIFQH
jgi:ATP-binding cassette subfamily B (MDR/TAP) protein 1